MKTLTLLLALVTINFQNFRSDDKNEIAGKMNSLMNDCKEYDLFSGTILIAKNGEIVFENSYGWQNKKENILNSNFTKYNIGSIGKEFTAIMILQLAQENKLDLNDKLGKFLNYFPEDAASKVTINHLLTHSSGFGDYIMNREFQKNKDDIRELTSLLRVISKEQLEFEPGTQNRYSNSGYAVLGGIIESITGKSYSDNLKERILNPLSMNSSGYIYRDENDPLKSIGYTKSINGEVRDNGNFYVNPSPAGGMFSTVEDMLKLDQSLMNDNKLLDDKFKLLLLNHFNETSLSLRDFKADPKSRNIIAGGAPGINALYMSLPSTGYSAFILSNYDQAAEYIEPQISSILNGNEYEKPKPMLGELIYNVYKENGKELFAKNLREIVDENKKKIEDDRVLNNIGYQFLQNKMPDAAIEIFKLNVQMFPDVANCYDSLGEAYMMSGNKELAKENYSKVLMIDPGNENAKKMLETIN